MQQTTNTIVPLVLLGLLILTTPIQAKAADQTSTQAVETTAIKADSKMQEQKGGTEEVMDPAKQRDLEARKKAKEVIQEMEKKLSTQ